MFLQNYSVCTVATTEPWSLPLELARPLRPVEKQRKLWPHPPQNGLLRPTPNISNF